MMTVCPPTPTVEPCEKIADFPVFLLLLLLHLACTNATSPPPAHAFVCRPSMILARGAMTVFLPRQEILLEHIAREVQNTTTQASECAHGAQNVEALVGGAASGVVAGFLEDWRDRATLLGLVFYLLCGAACAAVDYSIATAASKKKAISDSIDATEAKGRSLFEAALAKVGVGATAGQDSDGSDGLDVDGTRINGSGSGRSDSGVVGEHDHGDDGGVEKAKQAWKKLTGGD